MGVSDLDVWAPDGERHVVIQGNVVEYLTPDEARDLARRIVAAANYAEMQVATPDGVSETSTETTIHFHPKP